MARKSKGEKLLNSTRRRIFRRRITRAEQASVAVLFFVLVAAGFWIFAQADNFDPASRDVSYEALQQASVVDTLYHSPLRRFRDPYDPAQSSDAAVPIEFGIFPKTITQDGWRIDGRVEEYDRSNVYEKINGAAEQYNLFGFERLHYVTLVRNNDFINIEIYDQGSFPNALGIFSAQRSESTTIEEAEGMSFYRTSVGAIGIKGHLYFKITASVSGPEITRKADALVESFSGLPAKEEAASQIFDILRQRMKISFADIAFQAENVLQLDFLSDFWFGRIDGEEGRIFIHKAGSAEEAKVLFRSTDEENRYEYDVLEDGVVPMIYRHQFHGKFFALEQRAEWLFGVEGAASAEQARLFTQKLRKAIDAE